MSPQAVTKHYMSISSLLLNDLVKENCYAELKGQFCSLPPRDLFLPELKGDFQLLGCSRLTINLSLGLASGYSA